MKERTNRIESPAIDSHRYSHLIFDKGTRALQCNIVFSTNNTGITGHAKKINLELDLTLLTHINSKRIRNLNVKHKSSQKTTQEKIQMNLGMAMTF